MCLGDLIIQVQEDLAEHLKQAGVSLADSQQFSDDPCAAVKTLKEKDVRIVIGQFDEFSAAKVFCCVHQLDMFGNKYQWILSGWSETSWWTHTGTSSCSAQSVLNAMEGAVSVDFETLSSKHIRGVSGKTPQEYRQEYDKRCMLKGLGSSKFHGFAYDGTWVLAKALTRVMESLKYREKYSTHPNFTVTEREMTHMILQAMSDTKFFGVTGHVMFRNGERVASIKLAQFRAGREVSVGEYSSITDRLEFASPIWFKGEERTRDHTQVYPQRMEISMVLYSILASITVLGILMAIVFLIFNIQYRNHRVVQMSSPLLNTLLILGTLLSYSFIFLFGLNGSHVPEGVFDALCAVRIWLIVTGHSTVFGTMFAKIWRIYAIYKNIIKDYMLTGIVCGLLLVDMCFLITLHVLDPLRRTVEEFGLEADPHGRDFAFRPFLEHCENIHMNLWMMIIYLYKTLLMLILMRTDPDGTSLSKQFHAAEREKESEQVSEENDAINQTDSSVSSCLTLISTAALEVLQSDNEHLIMHISELDRELEELARQLRDLRTLSYKTMMNMQDFGELTDIMTPAFYHHYCIESVFSGILALQVYCHCKTLTLQYCGYRTCLSLQGVRNAKRFHVHRRLSLQLPILHHAYLPSIGGVDSSCSPPSSPSTQQIAIMGLWH
ncbi:hypothetical protein NFI96_031593 [Prochilodus magdalenae]|nr:hypothetical protein NFI96_031593 [Prochilodus magdalenae]